MKLSDKAQTALDKVIAQFKRGDLSPVVEIARIQRQPGDAFPADKWSLSNRVLAYIQTESLDCRGYRQWQKVGRQVKKGAHAAFILAPCTTTVEDEGTGEKRRILRGFKAIPVFPYHATDGEPLPEYDYTPRQLPPLVDVAQGLGVKVTWGLLPEDRLGDCDRRGRQINLGAEDASVFFHELAHACHARIDGGLKGGQRSGQETVAEFTAAVLMELYGARDHTGNAWDYIARHAADPLQAIVKALGKVEQVLALLESV